MTKKKEIGLVLTSGGARGLAQIGAIQVLEEHGYAIKAISGSSMGAVIGGFYATGKIDAFAEWIITLSKMDVFNLFDFTFSSQGFIKGERIFLELGKILNGDVDIEKATIPFYAVATDIMSKEPVWFSKGSLFEAIRASVSIPTIVTPYIQGKKILIDGGVSCPAPFLPLLDHNLPTVIINVNADIDYEYPFPQQSLAEQTEEQSIYAKRLAEFKKTWEKYIPSTTTKPKEEAVQVPNIINLLNLSVDYMEDLIIQLNIEKYKPSITIDVSRQAAGTVEFFKAEELIEAGRQATYKALKEL